MVIHKKDQLKKQNAQQDILVIQSKIEQDRAKPSYENLVKICNIFNVSLDDIFSDYLDSKVNKKIYNSLVGFDTLEKADKETIEHLITYFNKSKVSQNFTFIEYRAGIKLEFFDFIPALKILVF